MLNKTNIEWTDFTWNPVTGCNHGCSYCYAARYAVEQPSSVYPNGFEPTFHPRRLRDPLYEFQPSKIFVCSMGDLWSPGVNESWRSKVMETVRKCPHHTFQFLSKNVSIADTLFPSNVWAGMSIEGDHHERLKVFNNIKTPIRFLSIEPLIKPPTVRLDEIDVHWIIIGAQTGPEAVKPKREWVDALVIQADALGIPVFIKNSISYCFPNYPRRQEYPCIQSNRGKWLDVVS